MTVKVCGAKTRNGGTCRNKPVRGRTRCRMHGGASLVGIAHPSFTTGKHSKYLPMRLQEAYAAAMADPDLLGLRSEIALLDARLLDLLGRVDSGESGQLWDSMRDSWLGFTAAARALSAETDPRKREVLRAKQNEAAAAIEGLVEQGTADSAAWAEALAVVEQRRRLVETERKMMHDMQQTITSERAMALMSVVLVQLKEAVERHADERTGRSILSDASAGIRQVIAADAG